ncbi:hypothetical protein NIE88_15005 [Sporolactobacillus shoreicorticis]|uniref:Uncharacterized protein n=1 Tax=Sporolactobacillus shoreicorticis TaxID=1923877 RepID=A0ABW5S3U1_9BACL|nr:hypothetical protein [Sporolactobacillus shoreicorticis]MCO7127077.1 hypothetical protein [Sporolactobacillus shoreicorticis]
MNGDVKALLLLDQRVLLIVSSLGLFVVAGLVLKRSTYKLVNEPSWRKRFRYFNFVGVLAVIFFGFILVAGAIDYWLQR